MTLEELGVMVRVGVGSFARTNDNVSRISHGCFRQTVVNKPQALSINPACYSNPEN